MTKTIKIAALLSLMTTSGVAVGGAVLAQNNALTVKGADSPLTMNINSSSETTDVVYNSAMYRWGNKYDFKTYFNNGNSYVQSFFLTFDPTYDEVLDNDLDSFDITFGGDAFVSITSKIDYGYLELGFQLTQPTELSWSVTSDGDVAVSIMDYDESSYESYGYIEDAKSTTSATTSGTTEGSKYYLSFGVSLDNGKTFKLNSLTTTYYCK